MSNLPVDHTSIEEWTEETWNYIANYLSGQKNKENLIKKIKEKRWVLKVPSQINSKTLPETDIVE
jgi:hypothetical protein